MTIIIYCTTEITASFWNQPERFGRLILVYHVDSGISAEVVMS